MADIPSEIQSLPIFQTLNNKELEYLIQEAKEIELSKGEKLFEQNDDADNCFYIILDGKIGIEKFMRDENENVTILEAGEFFGEFGLFTGGERMAGAVAEAPSRILEVDQATVGKMKAQHPEALIGLYEHMFKGLAGRFNALAQKAEKTQFWL